MADQLLTLAWRRSDHVLVRDDRGGEAVSRGRDCGIEEAFVWRQGRADVTLRREGEAWAVVCTTVGRLRGPRNVLHSAKHRRADHAVWDVMARVIRVTKDEDQGLRAGADAAHWIREAGIGDEGDDDAFPPSPGGLDRSS
jgi:hypothetical protein